MASSPPPPSSRSCSTDSDLDSPLFVNSIDDDDFDDQYLYLGLSRFQKDYAAGVSTICFRSIKLNPSSLESEIYWYALNVAAPRFGNVSHVIALPFSKEVGYPCYTCVYLNSYVYSLGGSPFLEEYSSDVQILDTKLPIQKRGWNMGTSMKGCRFRPHVWVINRKLYVLGGTSPSTYDPILEFMDKDFMDRDRWTRGGRHPTGRSKFFVSASAYLDWRGEIVAGSAYNERGSWGCFSLYVISSNSWEPFNDKHFLKHANRCSGKAVVHCQTGYWFNKVLLAYDFEKKMWYCGAISGLDSIGECSMDFEPLLSSYLDGLFVLTWLSILPNSKLSRCMNCTVIEVTKRSPPSRDGDGLLHACVLDSVPHFFKPGEVFGNGFVIP